MSLEAFFRFVFYRIVYMHIIQIIKINIVFKPEKKYTLELHLLNTFIKIQKTGLRSCYEDIYAKMLGYNILSNVDHIANSI